MKHNSVLAVVLALALCILFSLAASADMGNVNRYDDDGGSSSSDWSGGDFGGSSSGNGIFLFDSNGFHVGALPAVAVIAVFVIVVFIIAKRSKVPFDTKQYRRPAAGTPIADHHDRTEQIVQTITALDADFSAPKFLTYVKETYLRLQTAWANRDMDEVRLLESEELFSQHQAQLEEYLRLGRINRMERITVRDAYLVDFSQDAQKEYLKVYLYAIMRDYIIDEKTGKVLEGRADIDSHMKYILTFTRSKGVKTRTEDGLETTNCPNCGAPTEVTSTGKCKYCGSLFTSGTHAWVLSDIAKA